MKPLAKLRFDALAGYSRSPYLPLSAQELGWYEIGDEKLLGVVSLDTVDGDYVSTVLAQDARNRFRAVRVEINTPSQAEAEQVLERALAELVDKPSSEFHQGDEVGRPMDFFSPRVAPTKQHAVFQALTTEGYSPALGVLRGMMHYHVSAVLANPGGTISKFNRIGFLAGFGNRSIKMIRSGFCHRGELVPQQFSAEVHDPEYCESWCEGLSVYHNPAARIPLPEFAFPGAAHHTARDGRILTSMPPFFPVGSNTLILVPE